MKIRFMYTLEIFRYLAMLAFNDIKNIYIIGIIVIKNDFCNKLMSRPIADENLAKINLF